MTISPPSLYLPVQSQSGVHTVLPLHNLPPEKEKHSAYEEERGGDFKQDLPFRNQNEAHTGLLLRSWLPIVKGEAQNLVKLHFIQKGQECDHQLQPFDG